MIEIIQTGQSGKTMSIVEMHKIRKLIFKDRMGWDVDINDQGLEVDEFDLPETVYILVRDEQNRVTGVWRMLPSSCPSMIREIWPEFLNSIDMTIDETIWEVSRFGVHNYTENLKQNIKNVNQVTAKLIVALLHVCCMTGIKNIYTMYNPQVERSVRKVGFYADEISDHVLVDGKPSVVGRVKTDLEALKRVQEITGISSKLTPDDLPPILYEKYLKLNVTEPAGEIYA